jgi:hypothetical protein
MTSLSCRQNFSFIESVPNFAAFLLFTICSQASASAELKQQGEQRPFKPVSLGLASLFGKGERTVLWERVAPTPNFKEGWKPQGLVFVNGRLYLAVCNDAAPTQVHELTPEGIRTGRLFDMPREATHTSGLAWADGRLLAVDYASNLAYSIDLERSLDAQTASIDGRFATGLKGTSACATITHDDRRLLIISDFRNSRRTIFVDTAKALQQKTTTGSTVLEYKNRGFSQGLLVINGFLLESENRIFGSTVIRMDIARLLKTSDADQARVDLIKGPARGVEDLASDGTHIWTTDEVSGWLFRARVEAILEP